MRKFFLFVIISSVSCNAQNVIKYKLEKSMVYTEENSYSIIIKLNKVFTPKFKSLTKQNIGYYLQIIYDDEIILGANIDSEMPNGLILISRLNDKRFNKIWEKLRE